MEIILTVIEYLSMAAVIGSVFLNHVTSGAGNPSAFTSNLTSSPGVAALSSSLNYNDMETISMEVHF